MGRGVLAMNITRSARRLWSVAAVALMITGAGCAASAPAETPAAPAADMAEQGARIWSVTCARCHNLRPASEFTAAEWPIIVDHMRTRQELTRSEAQAVAAFLEELSGDDAPR